MRLVDRYIEALVKLLVGIVLRKNIVLREVIGERVRSVAGEQAVSEKRQSARPDVASRGTELLLALKADVLCIYRSESGHCVGVDHLDGSSGVLEIQRVCKIPVEVKAYKVAVVN